jgi:hypothetical protein
MKCAQCTIANFADYLIPNLLDYIMMMVTEPTIANGRRRKRRKIDP